MTSSATGGSGVSPMNRMTIQIATQSLTENRKPNRHIPKPPLISCRTGHTKTPLSCWTEAFWADDDNLQLISRCKDRQLLGDREATVRVDELVS